MNSKEGEEGREVNGENKGKKDGKKNIFFKIFFNINTHLYYLQDMGAGYGTFIKITDEVIIKENIIINVGETYLIFSFDKKNCSEEENPDDLYLKIYSNENEYEPIILKYTIKPLYTLGRSEKCDVIIEDGMLSRIHCVLYYNNNVWAIRDGNENGLPSTNGTWVYASEETEIVEGMIFKSNSCNFVCKYQ